MKKFKNIKNNFITLTALSVTIIYAVQSYFIFKYSADFIIIFLFMIISVLIVLSVTFSKKKFKPVFVTVDKMKKNEKEKINAKSDNVETDKKPDGLNSDFNTMTNDLRSAVQKEKFLRKIMLTSVSLLDTKDMIKAIVTQTGKQFKADMCFIIEYDEKKQELMPVKDYQNYISSSCIKSIINFKSSESFLNVFKELAALRTVLTIDNLEAFNSSEYITTIRKEYGVSFFMAAPVAYRNIPLGLLAVTTCSKENKNFTKTDIDLLYTIAGQSAIAIHQAKLFNKIRENENIKKNFLTTLTHDLRSPIYAEQKAVESILSTNREPLSENLREFLEDIYKTNEELLGIVNNLLAVYHCESGDFKPNPELTCIKEITEDAIRAIKPLADDHNSKITTNIQKNLPYITVDRNEISRVITNLISNAVRHTVKGTSIDVSAVKTDNKIQVSVNDDGQGVAEAEKANIFQRYPSSKGKIGTGLGLFLSKQIIEMHGGEIWFDSSIDKGTTFHFTLPLF